MSELRTILGVLLISFSATGMLVAHRTWQTIAFWLLGAVLGGWFLWRARGS